MDPHRLLLPEFSGLLGASSSTKLYGILFAFGSVHKALVAKLVLYVVVVRIWVIGVQPGTAKVAITYQCAVPNIEYRDIRTKSVSGIQRMSYLTHVSRLHIRRQKCRTTYGYSHMTFDKAPSSTRKVTCS